MIRSYLKVADKLFALTGFEPPCKVNLKCDPERAVELRAQYPDVQPGYHMNKKHRNTVDIESGGLPEPLVRELIDHSYDLVVSKLPKKVREELAAVS